MVFKNSQALSMKLGSIISKFEENFSALDNKVLFEESKIESQANRKKGGVFPKGKKLNRQGSRSGIDMDKPMSNEEKKALIKNIRNLSAPQLKGIIKIVKDMFPEKDGMLEFDIDNLPPKKCRELEDYVRKIRNQGRKGGNTPTSTNKPKNSNWNNNKPGPGYPGSKGQNSSRSGMPYGGNGLNRGMSMGSVNQSGLVDPNANLMGGNQMMDNESSDSDSRSSNSSIGSQDELGPSIPSRKTQSQMPNVGGMSMPQNELYKQNSTGDLYRAYVNRGENEMDSNSGMKKHYSQALPNNSSS